MPLTGNAPTEKDLAVINRQIAEIKKKIQLSGEIYLKLETYLNFLL